MKIKTKGFTLVEMLIGTALLLMLVVAIYGGFVSVINLLQLSGYKTVASQLTTEYLELARNLAYADVGLIGGVPAGLLERVQTVSRNDQDYTVTYTIRNIDDPFDGTIGGSPNDLTPADYKLVEVTVECPLCQDFLPVTVTGTIAPQGLELTTNNGALFVKVFDANGDPVSGAAVNIVNNSVTPTIDINEITNNDGIFQLVDTPPSNLSYHIDTAKSGYSSSRTYEADELGGATPVLPPATVATGTVTQISFAIDLLGILSIETVTPTCAAIGNLSFSGRGNKLIGTNPDVYKTVKTGSTDGAGQKVYSDLEWDTYDFTIDSLTYDLAGTLPLLPLSLSPGANQTLKFVLMPSAPNSLMVVVKDAISGLPLPDAEVTLSRNGSLVDTQTTNQGFFTQTDWSGGAGQDLWSVANRYYSDDGNVDTLSSPGEIKLKNDLGVYVSAGQLTSSIFDTGATSTVFYDLNFEPHDQATSTGASPVKLQLAAGNDPATTTWNFVGPDGTAGTYYDAANSSVAGSLDDNRYIRYRVYLTTADTAQTPNVAGVSLTYSSACTPYGQALFQGLSLDNYELEISKTGYQVATESINLTDDDSVVNITLSPL
ncbi:MAG: hypothetical protein COV09_00645 [Candidatus Vogelbacteria bacterium CG10_big_fil_rev_8_21_14_0_10_50_13]|uniref:Uncharacterized protein n=1 Tax=Candidatus Vogelbacteria bacterium CG10_big_fil_rev_8_21_14_0_10_50_13 TaxID=1975044 RepID=A0A2H0RGN2_9BACT|nr:MAG: hypothetical protein COV09_00645 [Candidatus Vogelbacteria bacterium CG10_big_fil_rev_8_21_14_0_10_50_13]